MSDKTLIALAGMSRAVNQRLGQFLVNVAAVTGPKDAEGILQTLYYSEDENLIDRASEYVGRLLGK